MRNRTSPVRRHTRFPVSWPVRYGGDEVLAEGTVLNLTQIGWWVAGPMPVKPGVQLTLVVWVPDKLNPLRIERATVLWMNGCEFAIEAHEMAPGDQAWVTEFLNRKLGLSWRSRTTGDPSLPEPMTEPSPRAASLEQTHPPVHEDLRRWFLAAPPGINSLDPDAHQPESTQSRGQDEAEDRIACAQWLHEVWDPTLRIFRGMMTRKSRRELTGGGFSHSQLRTTSVSVGITMPARVSTAQESPRRPNHDLGSTYRKRIPYGSTYRSKGGAVSRIGAGSVSRGRDDRGRFS